MLRKKFLIKNKLGLHTRAAATLVTHANHYSSRIDISTPHKSIDAKHIMDVLTLAAPKGTVITLIIEGQDEIAAMADLTDLLENKFGEEE